MVVPIAGSLLVSILISRVLPRAHDVPSTFLWLGAIVLVAVVTLVLLDRAASRLLPLAALLRVSLLFPDNAPKRFAVARRSGRWRDLQEGLRAAHEAHAEEDAGRLETIVELVLALSVHDRPTRGHSERVRVFTDLIADELHLSPDARDRLRWSSLLHDIGKLEVPAATLNKQGSLSGDEWATIHRHPGQGARIVAPLLPWLDVWGLAVEQHHERFDGTGYPGQLRAQQISLAGRIVSVADCYEVMTAPRAYKRAVSVAAARTELARAAGSQFDPAIVRAFLNISVGRLWRVIGLGALLAQIPVAGGFIAGARDWATPAVAAAAAVALVGLGGAAATSHAVAPPGAVAGVRDPHPAPTSTAAPPTPSSSLPPSAPATPMPTPEPPPQHYPIVFPMNPLPHP